ncbi:hypothetical protein BH10ACI1_BH10ACI1_07540 [soil metagenome]
MKRIFIGLMLFVFVLCSIQEVSAQRRKRVKKRVKKTTVTTQTNPSLENTTRQDQTRQTTNGIGNGNGVGNGSGIGRGSGSGNGIGNGNGVGNGSTTNNETNNSQITRRNSIDFTKGLQLISKPNPSYTDAARQNNVQGVVRLRVTFNANGTIGNVFPVTGLPFGLTEQAIKAARQIKFEPASKNGVPVTVTKSIDYNFNIY